MPHDLKPHDDQMVEAIARQICLLEEIDPDSTFVCRDCTLPHPLWETQRADVDMFLTAIRSAGLKLVGAQ